MNIRFQWLLVPFLAAPAVAQHGTLSGHVYYADTNRPARMATVMLESADEVDNYDTHAKQQGWFLGVVSVQTSIDGSFTIPRVEPGSYYVFATAPGYVSPIDAVADSDQQLRHPDKDVREKYAKLMPQIKVQVNQTSAVELRLERGAAIGGRVLFDDGSPAMGLVIQPLVRLKDKWVPFHNNYFQTQTETRTDDRGNYRFGGLPAGEYLMEADLRLSVSGNSGPKSDESSIPVYTGGVFFTGDAKPIALKLGEERAGEELPINLSKLHSVSGVIVAAKDGHVLNSGSVKLLHADDKTQIAWASVINSDDSRFNFNMVPEGDYILSADGSDVEYFNDRHSAIALHFYDPAEQAIHIGGDKSDVTVSLTERVAKPAQR